MNEKRLLFILATVQFCHIIDFMIIMPLGKTIMEIFLITPGQFSWVVSAYAGAALLGNLISTAFIDRFDRRSAMMFLFAGFTIGTLACAYTNNYWSFMLFRALTGAFGGTLGALVLAIIGDVIPLERRASAMGWVMTAFSAASVIGVPAGIWIAAEYSWQMPFLITARLSAFFWLLIPFLVPPLRGHFPHETRSSAYRSVAEGVLDVKIEDGSIIRKKESPIEPFLYIFNDPNQRMALLFTVVLMLGHFTIIPFIPSYMQLNVGFSDKEVGYIYFIGGLLTVVLLPLFG